MTVKIIDISKWQDPSRIDYDALAANVDGVILRACYGRYPDTALLTHARELTLRRVPIGLYHFVTQYNTVKSQIDAILGQIDELKTVGDFKLGVWVDVENEAGATPLTEAQVSSFIGQLEDALGFQVGIYTSRYYWDQIMRTDAYKSRKLWVAHYGAASPYLPATGGWTNWWLWQYTSNGSYPGYPGSIDSNHFAGDESDYADWIGDEAPPVVDPEPLYQIEIVNCIALFVHSGPDTLESTRIGSVVNGTIMNAYRSSGSMLFVGDDAIEGWVSSAYTALYQAPIPIEPSDAEKLQRLWDAHPELH